MKNKKGGILWYALVLIVLVVGFAVTANNGFDVDKFKTTLNWTNVNLTVTQSPDLSHAAESLVNGMGEALISFTKWAAQWASENPTVPWKLCIWIVIISICAPILYYLFQFIIILIILLREWFVRRREKKELNKYRGKHD